MGIWVKIANKIDSICVKSNRTLTGLVFVLALSFTLFLHGAVPFLAAPTLGQALWVAGFGYSFVNDSITSIYANNFGWPEPAPIAFGLTGAYPAGLFIAAGLSALDAYTATVGFWLSIAFVGAWRLSRLLGARGLLAILTATVWMVMPTIWVHSGYSMLSIGIALMPAYFSVAVYYTLRPAHDTRSQLLQAMLCVATCVVSIFTDGYTFVMFAVGFGIIFLFGWMYQFDLRKRLLFFTLPIQIVSFGFAYVLYNLYFPYAGDLLSDLDFFRGWGADLSFLAVPTFGISWIFDMLQLSVARSNQQFFGDSSVWKSTFVLPVVVLALASWFALRRTKWLASAFLVASLFGFYMALGPSLKIMSIKPTEMQQSLPYGTGSSMPSQYAVMPTGSALLSDTLPGFKSMRASYRWSVLGLICSWALVVLLLSECDQRKKRMLAYGLGAALFALNLPHLVDQWEKNKLNRTRFLELDNGLVKSLDRDLGDREIVAFLPFRNDFLATYVAPRIGIRTFNTGGDKNLDMARLYWPEGMQAFAPGAAGNGFVAKTLTLLARKEANAVVIPYFDMMRTAHFGPSPNIYKHELYSFVRELEESGFVEVQERDSYAVFRIKQELLGKGPALVDDVYRQYCIGTLCLKTTQFQQDNTFTEIGVFRDGGIESSNKAGFLIYGPYAPMKAGDYRLSVKGTVQSAGGTAWADVVSNNGAVNYGRFPLKNSGDDSYAVFNERVHLSEDVTGIEVRIFVGKDDTVRIDRYSLMPN